MRRATSVAAFLLSLGLTAIPLPAQVIEKPKPTPIEVKLPSRKEPVSYAKEIAEILADKCVGCHGSALAENRLNLETVAAMIKGGKRGPAIVPGKAEQSRLFTMAARRVEPVMPPRDKPANKPLSSAELGLLQLWIDAGAKDDATDADKLTSSEHKTLELGELPPGVHPINAVDLTADGARVAAGRANAVQVYDVDSGLEIITLGGHKDLIQSLRFSPDGTRLAAGSYQIVTIWDAPTGRPLKTLSGHAGPVQALSVAPDGVTAYSGGDDKTIRVWNLAVGKLLRTFIQPAAVTALAHMSDGKTLVAGGSDGIVRWLNAADGRERAAFKGHTAAVRDVAVGAAQPGGLRAASVSDDGTARIWTLADVAPAKASAPPFVLTGHKGPARAIATTPDGKTIVTAGDDGMLRQWNARDGSSESTLKSGHTGPILAVAVSPDGAMILTGSDDKTARLIARAGSKQIRTLTGHAGPVRSVAFSPRGDRIVTADSQGGLKVWETANGRGVIAFGHTGPNGGPTKPIQRIAFSGQGGLISASAAATLRTWQFEGQWAEHRTLGTHVFRVLALDFSPDGKLLATGGGEPSRSGEMKLWEVGKGLLARALTSVHSDTVFAIRFSPDGTKLASASADKFLKVTSVADGKLLRSYEGHTHHVMAVDWRSDGKQLVSGGADNVLKVWDFDSGEQLRTLQPAGKQITALRWIAGKPDVVGASGDTQVRIWNPENGGIARGLSGAGDYVYCVASSTTGTKIAAGSADGVLFVWHGQTGQLIRKLEPTPGPR
jgi:WD40 repeat protein